MTQNSTFLPVPEVKYNKKTPVLGEIEVRVHGSLIDSKMDSAFSNLQKRVSLPGFRKGKVPLNLVKQKYHEDVLHDVFRDLVSDAYRKAAIDNKAPVAGEPYITKTNLNEWKQGQALTFTAEVDLIPEIDLKKHKGLPITKKSAKVKEEDIEIVIKNLLEPKAELSLAAPEVKAAKGHAAIVDFEGSLDGAIVPEASSKNYYLELGSNQAIEDFQAGIIGMKAGETTKFEVTYPADYFTEKLQGKTISYSATLHELKVKKFPELTDELVKEFQATSVADFKDKVKKSLEEEMKQEHKNQTEDEVLLALLESNPFEVPPSLVQRQMQNILTDVSSLLRRQKFGDTVIQDYMRKHAKDFQSRAEREVKLALLLPKIIEVEKIDCTEADLKGRYAELSSQSGQEIDAVEKFYKESPQRLEELKKETQRKKALQILVDNAKAK